jgi:hypothetical protein
MFKIASNFGIHITRKISSIKKLAKYPVPVGILIFGSLWGLLQGTVGAAFGSFDSFFKSQLHVCPCPLVGAILGIPIMTAALAIYKRPAMLIGIGAVAIPFSFLAIPIQHIPAFTTVSTTYPIINPIIAMIFSSVIFSVVSTLVMRKSELTPSVLIGAGASTGFLSSIAFVYTVVGLGAPILKVSGLSGPLAYIATNGVIWTAISAATSPVGYLTAPKLQLKISPLISRNTLFYRLAPVLLIALCLVGTALAAAVGLRTL